MQFVASTILCKTKRVLPLAFEKPSLLARDNWIVAHHWSHFHVYLLYFTKWVCESDWMHMVSPEHDEKLCYQCQEISGTKAVDYYAAQETYRCLQIKDRFKKRV